MVAGGVLAYLVLVPAIRFFGERLERAAVPRRPKLIRDMSAGEIRNAYVLYIGAGAVATGGIISLFQALPLIVSSLAAGAAATCAARRPARQRSPVRRTDRDLPLRFVALWARLVLVAG